MHLVAGWVSDGRLGFFQVAVDALAGFGLCDRRFWVLGVERRGGCSVVGVVRRKEPKCSLQCAKLMPYGIESTKH